MRKNFRSAIWKKFCKCKSVWKNILHVVFGKKFVSVKVYEKKFSIYNLKKISKCKSVWKKFSKCPCTTWKNLVSVKTNSDFYHRWVRRQASTPSNITQAKPNQCTIQ